MSFCFCSIIYDRRPMGLPLPPMTIDGGSSHNTHHKGLFNMETHLLLFSTLTPPSTYRRPSSVVLSRKNRPLSLLNRRPSVTSHVLRSKVGKRKQRISRRARLRIRLKHVLQNIVSAQTGLFLLN